MTRAARSPIRRCTSATAPAATRRTGSPRASPAGSPLYANPDLKKLLALVVGGGRFDSITYPPVNPTGKADLEARLAAAGMPYLDDTILGGHEWYVWRQLLNHFAANVAFRTTSTALSVSGTRVTATVTPATHEPAVPTGTVQFSAGGQPLGPH